MKSHALLACAALTMLTACAGIGANIAPEDRATPVASGFTPIALTPPPANFCQGAAASDRLRAGLSGFDAATVDRIALQSLQQCHTLLAGSFGENFERLASR